MASLVFIDYLFVNPWPVVSFLPQTGTLGPVVPHGGAIFLQRAHCREPQSVPGSAAEPLIQRLICTV
jgi:hypothetical protein